MAGPLLAAGARAAGSSGAAGAARAAAAERAAARRVVQADARPGWYASGEKKYRIQVFTAIAMITIAVIFDAIQFVAQFLNVVPGLGVMAGWYVAIFGQSLFFVWFLLLGVWGGPGGKNGLARIFTALGMTVPEWVPLLQAIPALTLGVVVMIVLTRLEDERHVAQPVTQGRAQPRLAYSAPAEQKEAEVPPSKGPQRRAIDDYELLQQEQLSEGGLRRAGGYDSSYRQARADSVYGSKGQQAGEEEVAEAA